MIRIFIIQILINFLILFSLIFSANALDYRNGDKLQNEFIIKKNLKIKLTDGEWIVLRRAYVTHYTLPQKIVGIARIENNEIMEMIEVYEGQLAGKWIDQVDNIIYQMTFKNRYDGCYERPEYYLVEVYKKGSTHNCMIVSHWDTNKEFYNPDDPELKTTGAQYKKYIRDNSIKIPPIALTSSHSYFSRLVRGEWYRIIFLANPKIYNSPEIKFFNEENSEFHKYNIDNYPDHKKLMEIWVSISSKRHIEIEKMHKAKTNHLLNLDKYIIDEIPLRKSNLVEEINKLNDLYKSGAITKEEFTKAKNKILN
tara:strand:+ start:406 stop:1335 length:930 start_codon:yes stop_codon:yes gene_type:complete